MEIKRIFVEKNEGFDIPSARVFADIVGVLKIKATALRLFLRYDIAGIAEEDFQRATSNVFSEPPCDTVYNEELPELEGYKMFAVEYLKGQYDQRADSAEQCVELLLNKSKPKVQTATVYAIQGVSDEELIAIQKYLINPTDSKLSDMAKPTSLDFVSDEQDGIDYIEGFIDLDEAGVLAFHKNGDFAMSAPDLQSVQQYFVSEKRNPTITEIKVIDTYWSDHCRHTTFLTELKNITIGDNVELQEGYDLYKSLFADIYKDRKDKYVCLMDIATIGTKALKKRGILHDLDESLEINACSIKVTAKVDGKNEDWLVMFKNETHNHPTEIEPFGGAATCLGGAIRDPLSGRVFVYQAMRITGAGDVFAPIQNAIEGKLPQRVISKTATAGFSSYGNQIGLATGIVNEVYHDNYVAKRLETGFVIGAAPAGNVRREEPTAGDKVILIGGATGRDGCGGATGSSKAHNKESVTVCGAEVQKGNPLTERKIQRFFRNGEATRLIKRCNDFGAGGVAVAIGELSDGLDIHLDRVPKKYAGLSVTETAISESQERMAIVVADSDVNQFLSYVKEENLEGVVVAEITDNNKMRMFNKGRTVVDIDRDFLNTNGVKQEVDVVARKFPTEGIFDVYEKEVASALESGDFAAAYEAILKDKNVMIQKGIGETFDSTIGGNTVLMPFGGKYQMTPAINMAARIPVRHGITDTTSIASWAFNPYITDANPYVGGVLSVLASVAKLVAGGVEYSTIRLTLQEFFKRLNKDSERFGEPFAAILGALFAQYHLGAPAIGGKDSMSGTFEDIDVPNTIISFAVAVTEGSKIINNVFKAGSAIYRVSLAKGKAVPDFSYVTKVFDTIHKNIASGNITAATVVEAGGAVSAITRSAVGDGIGVEFAKMDASMFKCYMGDLIIAVKDISALQCDAELVATTNNSGKVSGFGIDISIAEVLKTLSGFDKIYETSKQTTGSATVVNSDKVFVAPSYHVPVAKPRVLIPVFPGTNCEYDTARRFEREGAIADIFVIKNGSSAEISDSVAGLVSAIKNSQIIAFPGGFSGGDEPDGSGKFIAATFRNPYIAEAVNTLIAKRDGLAIGICNGFQALIKLGLLPYGEIRELQPNSPTLTYNVLNRHISTLSNIRIATTASPWLSSFKVGDVFTVPVSHGEGRFTATDAEFAKILAAGQVATQYVDNNNMPTMVSPFNPNGSLNATEGLISADGRIFGKMGHTERYTQGLYSNIEGDFDMNVFGNGIRYFK
ncbi:MAG: phosphoribosylformylglycinamidine synthase [Bacillota bacterium]